MKKFPHQQFIQYNNIELPTLPELIQKRIKGFEELEEDLQYTTDEDKEKLLTKLGLLSHELEEDLEEYFEQHLENNDQEQEEEDLAVPKVAEAAEKEGEPEITRKPEPELQEQVVEEIIREPEPPQMQQEQSKEPEPEPTKEPTDEEILEGLWADKKHKVFPTELKEKGFKGQLDKRMHLVGKFCLQRGKYDTCYKILVSC